MGGGVGVYKHASECEQVKEAHKLKVLSQIGLFVRERVSVRTWVFPTSTTATGSQMP